MRQAVEYIEARREEKEERMKEAALLLNGQAVQLLSGIRGLLDKRARFLGLEKLYPDWFGTRQEEDAAQVWRRFLGV